MITQSLPELIAGVNKISAKLETSKIKSQKLFSKWQSSETDTEDHKFFNLWLKALDEESDLEQELFDKKQIVLLKEKQLNEELVSLQEEEMGLRSLIQRNIGKQVRIKAQFG